MKITSAKFVKGIVAEDPQLEDGLPQYAFVGRSNVGKSSIINKLTGTSVARTSSYAGSTQEINMYLVNSDTYFLDLPGYGFAQRSGRGREKIGDLIEMYLFNPKYQQEKVILIIDANVGVTDKDASMFQELLAQHKSIIIVASKIDKMNQSELHTKITALKTLAHGFPVIPCSSKTGRGIEALMSEMFAS